MIQLLIFFVLIGVYLPLFFVIRKAYYSSEYNSVYRQIKYKADYMFVKYFFPIPLFFMGIIMTWVIQFNDSAYTISPDISKIETFAFVGATANERNSNMVDIAYGEKNNFKVTTALANKIHYVDTKNHSEVAFHYVEGVTRRWWILYPQTKKDFLTKVTIY